MSGRRRRRRRGMNARVKSGRQDIRPGSRAVGNLGKWLREVGRGGGMGRKGAAARQKRALGADGGVREREREGAIERESDRERETRSINSPT